MTKIDLINGFLGSGKTTFISRYLPWLVARGERVAVIENEFGTAGMDTAILSQTGAQVRELSGGCVCCGQKVNFYRLLRELCASGEWDRVIVEPSGVFNCDDFLDIVEKVDVRVCGYLNGIITVLAPADMELTSPQQQEMLYSQLHSTGAILLSQRDGPTEGMSTVVRTWVDQILAQRGCTSPFLGLIEDTAWNKLTDAEMAELSCAGWRRKEHWRSHMNHQSFAQSLSIFSKRAWDEAALTSALTKAMDGSCGTVYRIKGCVEGAEGALYQVNAAPGQLVLQSAAEWPGGKMLNVIGRDLDRAALKTLLT